MVSVTVMTFALLSAFKTAILSTSKQQILSLNLTKCYSNLLKALIVWREVIMSVERHSTRKYSALYILESWKQGERGDYLIVLQLKYGRFILVILDIISDKKKIIIYLFFLNLLRSINKNSYRKYHRFLGAILYCELKCMTRVLQSCKKCNEEVNQMRLNDLHIYAENTFVVFLDLDRSAKRSNIGPKMTPSICYITTASKTDALQLTASMTQR